MKNNLWESWLCEKSVTFYYALIQFNNFASILATVGTNGMFLLHCNGIKVEHKHGCSARPDHPARPMEQGGRGAMSWGIRKKHLISFFSGPKQHFHLILAEGMFVILIINSSIWQIQATCFLLLGQLNGYVTLAVPSKEHACHWLRPDAHWQCTNKSTCPVQLTCDLA